MGCPLHSWGTPICPHPQIDIFGGCCPPQGKDLPTLKDMDFLNKNEKVYVGEEAQREFMEKLKRDVEVGELGSCGGAGCPPSHRGAPPAIRVPPSPR